MERLALAKAGLKKKKLGNEQARLMFYSGAVWEAFREAEREKKKKKIIKESQVSGSFAHSRLSPSLH